MASLSGGDLTGLLAASAAAGAAALKVIDVVLSKSLRDADAQKKRVDARATEQAIASGEVAMLREIIAEVRASEAHKSERIDNLEKRLDLLEERERHMLTRAAVHEAWDQMAFALLIAANPDHPPPPPLTKLEQQ